MYRILIRPIIKLFSRRKAGQLALRLWNFVCRVPVLRFLVTTSYAHPSLQRNFFGLDFKNPVGIASGIDTDGRYFDELSRLGPSFVEIGPITFTSSRGHAATGSVIDNIRKSSLRSRSLVVANIAKDPRTLQSKAADEIDRTYTLLYDFVDAVFINLQGIRIETVPDIFDRVTTIRRFNDEHRPILVRLSPEISREELDQTIHLILSYGLDGIVIAAHGRNPEMLRYIREKSRDLLPVIVSGGIQRVDDARKLFEAGASMVEVSSFIKNGPRFIRRILRALVPKESK